MEQLLLHLFGDYVTQTSQMALLKRKVAGVAVLHAFVYALPFFILHISYAAFLVIFLSHFLIDHLALARYVIYAKNKTMDWNLKWEDVKETGYSKDLPAYMSAWLVIIVDNFMHLSINYCSIRWL
jgi:hypothetical protein